MHCAGDEHAAVDIQAMLLSRIQHWLGDDGLSKVIAATSDNGANVVNALRNLGVPFVLGCLAHTVHLAVEKGLKTQRVSRVLCKARKVVEHFNKSTKSTYQLRQIQVDAGKSVEDALGLIQDVPTRWTSTYQMLKRLCQLGDEVHRVLAKSEKRNIRELDLSAEDSFQLQELCGVLEPLSMAMQSIGGETYCSLSIVEPLLYKLKSKVLVANDQDTPLVYDFKTAALADLRDRYASTDVKKVLAAATALDPRFRDFCFIRDRDERAAAVEFARSQIAEQAADVTSAEVHASANSTDDDAVQEPPTKRARGEQMLLSFLTGRLCVKFDAIKSGKNCTTDYGNSKRILQLSFTY